MKKWKSCHSISPRNCNRKLVRHNSSPISQKERQSAKTRVLSKLKTKNGSTQTDPEIAYGSIILDTILNILLPTVDVFTDTVFFVGKIEQLYFLSPSKNSFDPYESFEEACKIKLCCFNDNKW